MKICFFSAWYPNKTDAMDGLFVRKHALAVALKHEVRVLFIKAVPNLKKAYLDTRKESNIVEHIMYYPSGGNIFTKSWRFLFYYMFAWKKLEKAWARPDIIHVNVLTRHAFMAYLLKLCYGIPYIITEHWTRYARGEFKGRLRRLVTSKVVREAGAITTVSEDLGQWMRKEGLTGTQYEVVRNVVDDFFFADPIVVYKDNIKTIVHICCFFEENKNNFGLLRSLKNLKEKRSDFRCIFVGHGVDWERTKEYAGNLGLEGCTEFVGEKTPLQIKEILKKSSFLVLFSRYETASVVVAESLAVGKPVVSSNIAAVLETVDKNSGYSVGVEDEEELSKALDKMLDHAPDFNSQYMRDRAWNLCSAERVGEQFNAIYLSVLNKASTH